MDVSNLTLEDCMCSICMCIYVEPVTMPCTHTLCMPCFKQNVEATSLTCPLCRKRISTWARRAARDKTLVNDALWNKIQSMFPDKVEKRLEGDDEEDDPDVNVFQPIINIAQPGEIRKEYEEQLKRLEKERELERQREQEASEALIKKLEEEGKMKSIAQQLIEERDQELARELENVVKEAGTDSPFNTLLRESRNRLTRSRGTSATGSSESNSPMTIEAFLQKMRDAEKKKEADRSSVKSHSPYPYKCFTPSDKDNFSRPSTITVSSRTSLQSSTSCTSYNTDADIEWEIITNNPENLQTKKIDLTSNVGLSEKIVNNKLIASTSVVRSASTQSSDSINQELNHFKPIRSCPLTPPKRLASGKVVETQVIRTTPRNLNRMDSFSPTPSKSLSDIDAGSPIMQRRWSELDEERKIQVRRNSKSTETTANGNDKKHDITKYFRFNSKERESPHSENIPDKKTGLENTVPLKNLVIPLEPIFDDIRDFDDLMAPLMQIDNIQKTRKDNDKNLLKGRHRNISQQENVNNSCVLSPQRSIKDWLSQVPLNSSPENSSNNCNNRNEDCKSSDIEIDSKEGILNCNVSNPTHKNTNKLKLKKYPKRRHTAYHISDYVYPQLSPKKKKINYIELSSDEEIERNETTEERVTQISDISVDLEQEQAFEGKFLSKPNSNMQRKRVRNDKPKDISIKKLKSVKRTKHEVKQVKVKTMHKFLKPKSNCTNSTNNGCMLNDNVFNCSSDVILDKFQQEEADRRLALELEKMFKLEEKSRVSAVRIKGSDNEYNFRRKSRLTS